MVIHMYRGHEDKGEDTIMQHPRNRTSGRVIGRRRAIKYQKMILENLHKYQLSRGGSGPEGR